MRARSRARGRDELARAWSCIRRRRSPGVPPPSSGSPFRPPRSRMAPSRSASSGWSGPTSVMSELRLFSSKPPPRSSRSSAIRAAASSARWARPTTRASPGTAGPRHAGPRGRSTSRTDPAGVFRVPLDGLPLGQHGELTIATGSGAQATELSVDTRHLARGLRELPPASDRLDLGGAWSFTGGPFRGRRIRGHEATTRVPGHIVYDGLVPGGRRRRRSSDSSTCPRPGRSGPCSCAATAPTGGPRCTSTARSRACTAAGRPPSTSTSRRSSVRGQRRLRSP